MLYSELYSLFVILVAITIVGWVLLNPTIGCHCNLDAPTKDNKDDLEHIKKSVQNYFYEK